MFNFEETHSCLVDNLIINFGIVCEGGRFHPGFVIRFLQGWGLGDETTQKHSEADDTHPLEYILNWTVSSAHAWCGCTFGGLQKASAQSK